MSSQGNSPLARSTTSETRRRLWTPAEDLALRNLVSRLGDRRGPAGRWKEIAAGLQGRTAKDCRKRWFHSLDPSLRKGKWTVQEDEILLSAHARLGPAWKEIAALIPGRKDDQCSKRYNNILNPSVRNRLNDWTPEEDRLLRQSVAGLGHQWAAISSRIPGRPPLTCRNRWRTLSRRFDAGSQVEDSNVSTAEPSPSTPLTMESQINESLPTPKPFNLPQTSDEENQQDTPSFPWMDNEAAALTATEMPFLDPAFYETVSSSSPSQLAAAPLVDADEPPGTNLDHGSASFGPQSSPSNTNGWMRETRSSHALLDQPPSMMPSSNTWSYPDPQGAGTAEWPGIPDNTMQATDWGLVNGNHESLLNPEPFRLPTQNQHAIHHHHHYHVHHHFHHYHNHISGRSMKDVEKEAERAATRAETRHPGRHPAG